MASSAPNGLADFYPKNGLLCSVCGKPQYGTPYGMVCADSHGGADGVTPEEWRAKTKSFEALPVEGLLDVADEIRWTAGKETFCPVKFHAFDVGPVTVTVRLRSGETARAAIERAITVARAAWDEEYQAKLAGHLERIREAAGAARG